MDAFYNSDPGLCDVDATLSAKEAAEEESKWNLTITSPDIGCKFLSSKVIRFSSVQRRESR